MKTRFAPSPTGYMHLGNLRTALFSVLFAKSVNGQFLLRIEDTDQERSNSKFIEDIFQDLKWLHLEWDEGPDKDLGNGPYFQSERQDVYDKYYRLLEEAGFVYPCFCTEEQLALSRKIQLSAGKPPRYARTCANLSAEETKKRIEDGKPYTLRFRVPENKIIEFTDLVKGSRRFNCDDIGDFIIRRTDGSSPFMFCNAIDDALMGVTHVLRGGDHVANTANQIMILEALKLPVPQYGHFSLIVGFDGTPLSKRHGSKSIQAMRQDGFLPGAIINYLARLGHSYEDNSYMSLNELAAKFSVERLSKSSAKFDETQLIHWQKTAISHLDVAELWEWMGDKIHSLVLESKKELFVKTVVANVVLPDDAQRWAQIFFKEISALDEEKLQVIKRAGKGFYEKTLEILARDGNDYSKVIADLKQSLGVKGKDLFMPLRIALTGETHGPELENIFQLLGVDELEKRLKTAEQ